MENGRISTFQMALLMYALILATAFISIPAISARQASHDFWMAPIIASLSGLLAFFLAYWLHRMYPGQHVIQYSQIILGRVAGKVLGLLYFSFLLQVGGLIARQYAEFVTSSYLYKTPLLFLIIVLVGLAAFAARGGVEILGRSAVVLTPIFALPLMFLLLLLPDFDYANLLPMMSEGVLPVLKGSTLPMAWYSEFFLVGFFLPYLSNPEKARLHGLLTLAAVVLSLLFVSLVTLLLLGPDVKDKTYPILTAFRYISRADFFENLEALLLAMWVVGNFIKLAVVYYITTVTLSTILGAKDYRPYIFPIGLLFIIYSIWGLPSFFSLSVFLLEAGTFHLVTYLLVIPLLLLLIAMCKKRWASRHDKGTDGQDNHVPAPVSADDRLLGPDGAE